MAIITRGVFDLRLHLSISHHISLAVLESVRLPKDSIARCAKLIIWLPRCISSGHDYDDIASK